MINSAQAWSASTNNTSQWVTMDLGEKKSIKGVQIQGRANYDQWIKTFKVSISDDNINFTYLRNETIYFVPVQDRNTINEISLERELINYESSYNGGVARSYGSLYGDSTPGKHYAQSTINSEKAYIRQGEDVDKWVQMDLGSEKTVEGVYMQGRADAPSHNQYVKTFKVRTSNDGTNWTWTDSEKIYSTGWNILHGFNHKTISEIKLDSPVKARYVRIDPQTAHRATSYRCAVMVTNTDLISARYVRIHPQTWNGHISMRCGVTVNILKMKVLD